MAGRVGRIAAVTAMVATGTGAAMFGAGTANAASNPLIVGGCDKAVSAQAGQAVKVDASGLLGQAVPPVYLGDAPSGGTSTMSVPTSKLVKTVRGVPLLGGLLSQVTGVIGPTCDVTVRVVNAVHAPVADSPVTDTTRHTGNSLRPVTRPVTTGVDKTTRGLLSDPANPGGGGGGGGTTPPGGGGGGGGNPNPGGGGGNNGGGKSPVLPNNPGGPGGNLAFYPPPLSPGGFGAFGDVFGPGARYGNLPFVTSGVFNPGQAGFGQQVPGFSPQFGNLNGDANDSVQNAGQAEAFGPSDAGNDVGLPLLVAVLALSGAGASLVRTWVLRRAS